MKALFFLTILIFQIAFIDAKEIVLLYGSGSVGKSTLSREIVSINPDWFHIDEDEIFNEVWLEHVSRNFNGEYESISKVLPHENLFQAIKNSTIIFPEDATDSQKESVRNAIEIIQVGIADNDPEEFRRVIFKQSEMSIIDQVRGKIDSDKSILLDRWYTTPEILYKVFPYAVIKKVLVFSTLEHALDNFEKRNQKAVLTKNSSSLRLYKHMIPSYVRLYKLSNDPTHSLYCYKRFEIESIFKEIREALVVEKIGSKKSILFNEMTKEGLDKLEQEFIPQNTSNDTLFLSPIDHYDFIVNTQDVNHKKTALKFISE